MLGQANAAHYSDVVAMVRHPAVAIYCRDPRRNLPSGWLVVNKANGRCHYYGIKVVAIKAARRHKVAHGGQWEVMPTYDPGPYIKPGAANELVG